MAAKAHRAPSWKNSRRDVAVIAVIDDGSERRLAADFAYYPPVPQARALDWTGARTVAAHRLGMGAAGPQPAADARPRALSPRPTLLVTMGGSDPQGLTLRAAQALPPLDPAFRIRFVIGTGMKDAAKVARRHRRR